MWNLPRALSGRKREIRKHAPGMEPGRCSPVAITAAVVVLVDRLMTFGYFIPTIIRLQRSQSPAAAVRAKFSHWITLNYLRVIFVLASWPAALKSSALAAG